MVSITKHVHSIWQLKKLLLVACILCSVTVVAQQNMLDTLKQRFDSFRKNNIQEKIYLQLDQSFYVTGETLWFKVYTTDGTLHRPMALSKIAYIEILDKDNRPVLQTKTTLNEGLGSGAIFIPATLNAGNYLVKVYTSWMKNFDPAFFYYKPITIVNTFVKPELDKPISKVQYDVQFFPEGGHLVKSLKSKIGFKIADQLGHGTEASGAVVNTANDTVANFSTSKFGMGNFYFTPDEIAGYKAIIRDGEGRVSTHPFVTVHDQGYVMHLEENSDEIVVQVKGMFTDDPAVPLLFLFVHARMMVCHAEGIFTKNNEATFKIKKSSLREGVSHFTIFNASLQPLCERLYFTTPTSRLSVNVSSETKSYSERRRVTLDLQSADATKPLPANLALSVFKNDSLPSNNDEDLFTTLWLTSELQGKIESPQYYFSNDAAVKETSDNLMLTQGWRRFKWEDVNKPSNHNNVPETHGHIIKAHVLTADGAPQPGIVTYLASPGKTIRVYGSRSNNKGEVQYEVKDFFGPRQLIIQTNTQKDSVYKIKVENPFTTASHTPLPLPFRLTPSIEKELLSRSIAMQVQDIYNSNKTQTATQAIDTIAFYGRADATYYLDDYTRFPVMEEVMREYVPGVLVRKRKDGFHFVLVDNVRRGVLPDDPMILLDGVPIFDADKIMAFDPRKVKKLEVLNRQYYLGQLFLPGIVSYSTYNGDLAGFQIDSKSLVIDYEGLLKRTEFYSPQYATQESRKSRTPDQRHLLYWNPEIKTGEDGKQQVQFYTSDVTGDYTVIVEGLTKDGLAGSTTYNFAVKRSDNY